MTKEEVSLIIEALIRLYGKVDVTTSRDRDIIMLLQELKKETDASILPEIEWTKSRKV